MTIVLLACRSTFTCINDIGDANTQILADGYDFTLQYQRTISPNAEMFARECI